MEEFQAFLPIDLILILTYIDIPFIPFEFSCSILYIDTIHSNFSYIKFNQLDEMI